MKLGNLFKKEKKQKKELRIGDLPRIWDEYAKAGYEKVYLTHSTKEARRILKKFFELQKDGIVLDAGCGTGGLFKSIIEGIKPSKIIAVDWSNEMLRKARRMTKEIDGNPVIKFQEIDLSKQLPWSNNFFDSCVTNLTVCYLPAPGWRHFIKEAHRVIKKGGYLYLSTFLKEWIIPSVIKRFALREFLRSPIGALYGIKFARIAHRITILGEKYGAEYPSKEELIKFIKDSGFSEVDYSPIYWHLGIAIKGKK